MSTRNRLIRLFTGLLAVIITLVIVFSILLPLAHRWGATQEEIRSTLPGDELLDKPLVNWTNAITINAPPEKVWPWIIQIGERRGGYYSYTWIENTLFGKGSYQNANRTLPEFQSPAKGEEIIGGMLKIREYEIGRYMLAESVTPDFGWTWVWNVFPVGIGQTRLVIRNHVQPFVEGGNPVMTFVLDVGGFVMEQRMMQGIKLRAEGFTEPPYLEALEYILWLVALLTGIAAGLVFLFKAEWQEALLVGIASVVALPVFLIVQPPVWFRAGVDLILVAGLAWSLRSGSQSVRESEFVRRKERFESA